MDDGGQPSRSMAPFSNPMTREEYLLHKAKIDEARERLAQMELEIELQEAARQGREAEQKLEKMRAAAAAAAQSFSAGPSSASNSNHYPHANHQFAAVHEVPLTARIEGEVQDSPSYSSRPPVQVPLTHYNYPTISQPQQASFKAYAPQFSTQHPEWVPFAQTPAQATARSRKKPSTYASGPTFTIPRDQYSSTPSSTPSYSYQTMRQNGQSYQQQRLTLGEDYLTRQSQSYMAELAATGTQPTSSVGVNAQATLLSGTAMPQQPHVQRHTPLPAAPSEAASAVPSAQRPHSSTETQTSLNSQISGNDPPNTAIKKQEFIRQFQTVLERDPNLIRSFLSTSHFPLEWLAEAVSSIDPANLKDASAVAFLNDARNRLKILPPPQSTSTSVGTDVRIPTVDDAPSKSPATSIQPPPPPADVSSIQRKSTSLGTKEKYLVSFNEVLLRAGVDMAADFFLRNQLEVPREWQQALINSLTPEQAVEMHSAWNRAFRKAQEAKARLASSSAAKSDASPNDVPNIAQQNRSQTTTLSLNEVITQPASTKEFSKPVPVPPRPSVTRSFQSTSAQPPKTSTTHSSKTSTVPNHITTTTFAASQSTSAPVAQISAPPTTTAPLAPLMQPRIATSQQQPLTGTVAGGQAADNFRHYRPYGVPPPMSVPTGDGKHVQYVHDPYLNQYVRKDIANRLSNSSTSSRQQPSIVVPQVQAIPQGVSASTQGQATISIPPATPRRRLNGTVTEGRTPQQADKSRLARDILRSLGMDELPVMVAAEEAEESEAEEEAGVLGNLPATTESQEKAVQSQNLAQPFQVAAQDTSLVLPPTSDQHPSHEARHILSLPSDVPMEPERQSPTHEAPQHNSLILPLPSDVPMEQGKQPRLQATQSPIKAITIDLTMDDETTTAPGDAPTSLISLPPSAVASVPASTSTDRDELRRGVNEILPSKSPSPITIPRATSVSMDQHESAGVDGISIATDMHRPEPSREDGRMDSSISFPTLDEPLPPVSKPASSSSPTPNFRSQPRKQNEDIADEVLPLFLPSPSASPALTEHSPTRLLPDTDDDVVIVDSMLQGSRRRSNSDVLVSDGEGSLTPARTVRRKKGQRTYVLVPPPSPGLKRAIKKKRKLEGEIVSDSEEEESKYNDFERAFMIDGRFRMAERPCQWAGCDALMNSCNNLYIHLKLHAQEASSKGLHICRWQSCPRRFKSAEAMEKHLERHAYFPLPCPLENCPAVFDEPFDAIQHEVRQRTSTPYVGLKPPPNPYLPRIPPKLYPPPHIVPAYRMEPIRIRAAYITPQRHSVIGPWVLHNIFSPVEQNLRKQSGPMKFRYPRRDALPEDLDNFRARPDEYDFLASLSIPPTRTIRYDDLDSEGTSLALQEGITFWDTMSESDSRPAKLNSAVEGDADLGEDIVMETTDGGASHPVLVEDSIMSDPDAAISTLDEMYGSQWTTTGGGGEEEAVEMMLL